MSSALLCTLTKFCSPREKTGYLLPKPVPVHRRFFSSIFPQFWKCRLDLLTCVGSVSSRMFLHEFFREIQLVVLVFAFREAAFVLINFVAVFC